MLYKSVLKELPPTPLSKIKMGKMQYLAVGRIEKTEKCGEILIVDIYKREKPRDLIARFFTNKDNFQVYDVKNNKWTQKLLYKVLGGCAHSYYFGYYEERFRIAASEQTCDMVRGYLNSQNYKGDSLIYNIDEFIREFGVAKRERARENKWHRTQERMKMFPELPKEFKPYLKNRVFPKYAFADKKVKGKKHGVCSQCGRKFEIKGNVKHRTITECPKCHNEVIIFEKRYIDSINDKAIVCMADRIDGRLMFRWMKVFSQWHEDKKGKINPTYKIEEYFRTIDIFEKGREKTVSYDYKYIYPWGIEWREQKNYSCDDLAYVYSENLQKVFGKKYYNIDLQEELKENQQPLRFIRLLNNLKSLPPTEYLFKMGMYRLASELDPDTLGKGRNFQTILGVNPQYKKLYATYNVSSDEHYIIKAAKEWVSDEDFIKMRRIRTNSANTGTICNMLEKMSFKRFVNYFTLQRRLYPRHNFEQILRWYNDYIAMSEGMNVDLSHKSVRFPKDIKEAHDRIVKEYKIAEDEILDNQFKKATENLYNGLTEYKSNGYAIVFPQSRQEFIAEGQSLNHCVGTQPMYYNNHVAGIKMIFFVRRANEIEKPFVTMEIDMRKLIINQIYGYGDKRPEQPVIAFANKFLTQLKKDTAVRRVR